MASFSVPFTNNGGNLEELQSCLNHTQSSRPGMLYKKNFLSYRLKNHHICSAQKLSNLVVNNFSGSSFTNSAPRSDGYLSSSSPSSFVFGESGNKIYSTRKTMVDKEEDVSGKLDQWIKDSVVEIVNYLDEAPFLVHIYADGEVEEGSGSASTKKIEKKKQKNKLVKEKAVPERWPLIKERWGNGESPTPNGIILVEEMKGDGEEEENSKSNISSTSKVWGILIQGKGANYPACYILKTSRVRCLSGFCTHFCLFKVECFTETIDVQFKKLWLV